MIPPVRRVTATSSRGLLGVADFWSYRELLYFLTWRDVRVRYTQAVLGVAWAVLQPLTLMILFTIFFGCVAGLSSDGIPYPVFACGALVPWQLFSSSVANANESVVANERIITRIYFPRVLLPIASVLTALRQEKTVLDAESAGSSRIGSAFATVSADTAYSSPQKHALPHRIGRRHRRNRERELARDKTIGVRNCEQSVFTVRALRAHHLGAWSYRALATRVIVAREVVCKTVPK